MLDVRQETKTNSTRRHLEYTGPVDLVISLWTSIARFGAPLLIPTTGGFFGLPHGVEGLCARNTVFLLLDYRFNNLAQPNPNINKLN